MVTGASKRSNIPGRFKTKAKGATPGVRSSPRRTVALQRKTKTVANAAAATSSREKGSSAPRGRQKVQPSKGVIRRNRSNKERGATPRDTRVRAGNAGATGGASCRGAGGKKRGGASGSVDEGSHKVGKEALSNLRESSEKEVADTLKATTEECEAIVSAAMDSGVEGAGSREEDEMVAAKAQREFEKDLRTAEVISSKILETLKTSRGRMTAIVKRSSNAVDGIVQSEYKSLKANVDKAVAAGCS